MDTKPHLAKTLPALIRSHMSKSPRKPSEVVPEIHPVLESFILKSIEKEPASRYQTAEEMLSELEKTQIMMSSPKEEIQVLFTVIAMIASLIPVRRAMKIEPNITLRYE